MSEADWMRAGVWSDVTSSAEVAVLRDALTAAAAALSCHVISVQPRRSRGALIHRAEFNDRRTAQVFRYYAARRAGGTWKLHVATQDQFKPKTARHKRLGWLMLDTLRQLDTVAEMAR